MLNNLVYLKDGKGKTDSLAIAREFGKDHGKVLRKVRECINNAAEKDRANFGLISRTDEMNREQDVYEITRDGFMFLVMGFTGKKADAIKWVFIEEFNRMEAQLVDVGLQPKRVWYRAQVLRHILHIPKVHKVRFYANGQAAHITLYQPQSTLSPRVCVRVL